MNKFESAPHSVAQVQFCKFLCPKHQQEWRTALLCSVSAHARRHRWCCRCCVVAAQDTNPLVAAALAEHSVMTMGALKAGRLLHRFARAACERASMHKSYFPAISL